ncbi:hypothetical protein, partial [Nostoc sp.]
WVQNFGLTLPFRYVLAVLFLVELEQKDMPQKRCGLGFDCGSMMLHPGIDPGDCENYTTCGAATRLTPEEEFELIRIREIEARERQEQYERYREIIRVNRHQAALMMLMSRGYPQTPESLGLVELLNQINTKAEQVRSLLAQFEGQYIAPEKCEVHIYNVKRPAGTYEYNKLTAGEAIFEPSEKTEKVKVIHLSSDSDPRNLEGRAGVERRHKLTQARTQMNVGLQALTAAVELLTEGSSLQVIPQARTELDTGNGEAEAVAIAPEAQQQPEESNALEVFENY